jgi:hypothetical protein
MKTTELTFNLDDENEVAAFVATYGTLNGRALANRLGFSGTRAVRRANDLSCYAWNKSTAISCRKRGEIQTALSYEAICDRIYKGMNQSDRW